MQRWLLIRRSAYFKLKLAGRIIKALLLLYCLVFFFYMGFILDVILTKVMEGKEAVTLVNRNMVTVFLLMTIVRFFIQKLPAVDMLPYLNLPLRKSGLVRAWLLLSFINGWTILPFAFLLPFWVKIIMQKFIVVESVYWLLGLASLVLISNLIVILLKALLFDKPLKFLSFVFLFGGALLADKILKLHLAENLSDSLFTQLLSSDTAVLLLLIFLLGGFFYWTSRLVRERLYLEAC